MDDMMNYQKAFSRPFQDWTTLGIGYLMTIILVSISLYSQVILTKPDSLIYLIPIIVVEIIFTILFTGYGLVCASTANDKKLVLPKWENFGDLFVKGFFGVLITMIYLLPIIIIFIIALLTGIINFTQTAQLPWKVLIFIFSVLMPLAILTVYVLYSALINYSRSWKFSDGFKFSEIMSNAFSMNFFLAMLAGSFYASLLTIGAILIFMALLVVNQTAAYIIYSILISAASIVTSITIYTLLGMSYSKISGTSETTEKTRRR